MIAKWNWNDCKIPVISGKFHPEKHDGQLYFPQKKKLRPTSQNGRFPILRPNLRPLSGIENFFSQNLTYSYSFLVWNLPGITMSLESLHNYFVITVKSRKTMKNSDFSRFDCDTEIMLKRLQDHGNLLWISPQKTLSSTFFSRKKKIPSDIPKWSFSDFKIDPETPFGNRKFFFLKI